MHILYSILLTAGFVLALPWFLWKGRSTGKYLRTFRERMGRLPVYLNVDGDRSIWIHAVSVGEVTAAAPIVALLRTYFPKACIVFSTGTETGQEMARRIATAATSFIYYPLDIPWVVRKFITRVNPDIFILTETELWPNFMRACRERGVKIVMVNGRISPRSFRRYAATRFFWKGVLDAVIEMGVISHIDAERLRVLGMPPSRIHIMGNAKYDSLAAKASHELRGEAEKRLNITGADKVFVAGSTHEGEEKIILHVYRGLLNKYPDFKLIIIPRHPERAQAVLALARESGFDDCITMTELIAGRPRTVERIVIVDVIGELFNVYSLATVVFCGGSLVPKGGQNILEPAAWGKVIFYGPSMDDFREEKDLLEKTGTGITVGSGNELLEGILTLLSDPEDLLKRGEAGRKMVIANTGAAEKYAGMVRAHIKSDNSQ